MNWLCWHVGTVTDPKLRRIADECRTPLANVVTLWAMILESAKDRRGAFSIDAGDAAYLIGAHEGDVCAVLAAFEQRGLTNCGTVAKWKERQHGTSAARMAEKRKRERSEDVTHSDAHSVNVRTVTPTIQDKTIHDITLQDRKKDIDGDSLIRRASREKQATRYPEDFAPEENQDIPPEVVAREGPKFADYWRGVPGARGRKLDWQATWRNWCRKAMENGPNAKFTGPRYNPADASSPESVAERRAKILDGMRATFPGFGAEGDGG